MEASGHKCIHVLAGWKFFNDFQGGIAKKPGMDQKMSLPNRVCRIECSQHGRVGIEIRGDERTCELISTAKPATDDDYGTEYLGPIISSRVVGSLDEAIEHINRYGSKHTDAIVTANLEASREFAARVDSSAVMINASTRFNDGGQFGLGAEIGISTDKFHARGPCGIEELTSYKYVVHGDGQTRE